MSYPSQTGNGCSLEDCYTNLFALTDLCGIRWRILTVEPESVPVDQLDDPVLLAYSKCIRNEILCVWRRVLHRSQDHIAYRKELWIFWYGKEPDILENLLTPDLKEAESGAWDKDKEKDTGLSYKCRTLLFKALHNLIERCLLSKNFVRLGKWFVLPYDQNTPADRSAHLSFAFHFFLHGESQVCASIEVKQHPPVWRLTPQHLSLVQENHASFQVILAPYGLNGALTGHSYRDNDQGSRKLIEEWRLFYPVEGGEHKEYDPNKISSLVEVVVAGVRLRYPSCYVLICENEDSPVRVQPMPVSSGMSGMSQQQCITSVLNNGLLTPPTSPGDPSIVGDTGVKVVPVPSNYVGMSEGSQLNPPNSAGVLGRHITEKVTQDACITVGMIKRSGEASGEELSPGVWNFADPCAKVSCSCIRHRKNKPVVGPGKTFSGGKHGKGDKQEKLDRQQSRHGRNVTPFHRRSPVTDDLLQFDMDHVIGHLLPNPAFCSTGSTTISSAQGQNTPSRDTPVDIPPSAPLPLDEPQPLVNSSMDPPMPTLSPHPPAKLSGDGEYSTKANSNVPDTHSNMVCNGFSEFYGNKNEESNTKGLTLNSPSYSWNQLESSKNETVNNWLQSQQHQVENQGIKRPSLPSQDNDEDEEVVADSLYNFNPLQAWISLPVKKARYDTKYDDLGSPHHSPSDPTSSLSLSHSQRHTSKPPTPSPPAPDIYEFSDENSFNPGSLSRGKRKSRDDLFPRPSPIGRMDDESRDSQRHSTEAVNDLGPLGSPQTPGSTLMREKDLVPAVSDLDHIFESSGEDSDDAGGSDLGLSGNKKGNKIAPSELARMYPTPPSDSNKAPSPETLAEAGVTDTVLQLHDGGSCKMETQMFSSITDEFFKEDVFRPAKLATFVSAPKYAQVDLVDSVPPATNDNISLTVQQYKPSWHFPLPIMEKPQSQTSQYLNLPSIENIPSLTSRLPTGAIESSPATFNSINQQRTPMSFELQSPASNASSYLNKTLNSIDNHGTNQQLPEVHSLVVNILLSDSILNLFKDHNFDSCNICVCNLDIKGSDIGLYVPDAGGSSESSYACSCGFSAVMNRQYGFNSGLFYEDEVEITGIRDERFERRKPSLLPLDFQKQEGEAKDLPHEDIPRVVLELLLGQFTVPYPTSVTTHQLSRLNTAAATTFSGSLLNLLQVRDGNEVAYNALEQGRQAMENYSPNKLDDLGLKQTCLHKWPYLRDANRLPLTTQDALQLLKSLQPLLQEAFQSQRATRLWDKLLGPLSWKDFHQLAGRGSDENCEPQPIPYLLVGYDRDWLSVSPYSIRYWDKQFLEPFSRQRDIAYVVVAPDNDFLLGHIINYFRELSTIYELCRLGKHSPNSKVLRDGILRVGKKAAQTLAEEQVDEWFEQIGDSPLATKLKLYAQVCRYHLGPLLAQQSVDKSLFESSNVSHKPTFKTPEPATPAHPPTPENQLSGASASASSAVSGEEKGKTESDGNQAEGASQTKENASHDIDNEDRNSCPAVVVYLINPFTYGQEWDDVNRLAMIGLLRCYHQMIKTLPENLQNNMFLQVVPLESILEHRESGTHYQTFKSLAFSAFTNCRWNLSHTIVGRSLTGFGPAAAADQFLKKKEVDRSGIIRLYSPPFILAPLKDKQSQLAESCGEKTEKCDVIFCSYCLSEDQRWLLAACTDERGEMLETIVINIEIPNRNRRKKASARKIGLQKLWDFIVGIVSMTTQQTRLVVGRFGRIGHSELKGWSGLLSKNNLQSASKQMKDMCGQCSVMSNTERPCFLSACLVSLEPQPSLQVMFDAVKLEEKMSSNCPLQTPRDASCTHILVFPTSAMVQANSQSSHGEQPDLNPQLEFPDVFCDLKDDYLGPIDDGMNIFDVDLFDDQFEPGNSPPNSDNSNNKSASRFNGPSSNTNGLPSADPQSDVNLLQQPLAMGYYISTAKAGPLPKWFWSACPENENVCPHTFKAALHIHASSSQDDFSTQSRKSHPLDSHLTCDVLRFVLENYNALSWLTYDPSKNDRRSCLPIHMVVLMQMYQALNTFV